MTYRTTNQKPRTHQYVQSKLLLLTEIFMTEIWLLKTFHELNARNCGCVWRFDGNSPWTLKI